MAGTDRSRDEKLVFDDGTLAELLAKADKVVAVYDAITKDREVQEHGAALERALGTLTDGVWRWREDLVALFTVASAFGGLGLAIVGILMQLGVIGG